MASAPVIVQRARALAAERGFANSCSDDVGSLLRSLAATIADGVVAEIGTGCGVGAAWIASGLRTGVRLVTIELDEGHAAATSQLFAAFPNVRALRGDWRLISAHAPFALLFADAAGSKDADLYRLIRPGGIVVLDDLTDPDDWDDARRLEGDPLRERWLSDDRYASIVVGVGRDKFGGATRAQALLATRL